MSQHWTKVVWAVSGFWLTLYSRNHHMSAIHYSTLHKHASRNLWSSLQRKHKYADWVCFDSRTQYWLCAVIFLFFYLCFAQPLNWWARLWLGRAQLHCDLTQSQFFMRAYILYSLCINCIINCSFSMHLHLFQQNSIYIYIYIYTKHEKYFKGIVIILITWWPPIGWWARALAQSRLWIIRPWWLDNFF